MFGRSAWRGESTGWAMASRIRTDGISRLSIGFAANSCHIFRGRFARVARIGGGRSVNVEFRLLNSFSAQNEANTMKSRTSLRKFAGIACSVIFLAVCGFEFVSSADAQDAGKHAITFVDMMKLHRVAEPALSPDGKWVVYTVATPDMDANRNASNIWLVSTEGGAPIQLTQSGKDSSPVWSPDGKMIAFLSSRSGDSQVYLLSMNGGEAHPWTTISTGVDLVKWSPDGKTLAFTSGVYPDCKDDACNKK